MDFQGCFNTDEEEWNDSLVASSAFSLGPIWHSENQKIIDADGCARMLWPKEADLGASARLA